MQCLTFFCRKAISSSLMSKCLTKTIFFFRSIECEEKLRQQTDTKLLSRLSLNKTEAFLFLLVSRRSAFERQEEI